MGKEICLETPGNKGSWRLSAHTTSAWTMAEGCLARTMDKTGSVASCSVQICHCFMMGLRSTNTTPSPPEPSFTEIRMQGCSSRGGGPQLAWRVTLDLPRGQILWNILHSNLSLCPTPPQSQGLGFSGTWWRKTIYLSRIRMSSKFSGAVASFGDEPPLWGPSTSSV